MEECAVCGKEFRDSPYEPVCSRECFFFWVHFEDHKDKPCWIAGCLEVYCGTSTPGYCVDCQVFKIEEEIRKRGLNKETLIGNY